MERFSLARDEHVQNWRSAGVHGRRAWSDQRIAAHRLGLIITRIFEVLVSIPAPLVHRPPCR